MIHSNQNVLIDSLRINFCMMNTFGNWLKYNNIFLQQRETNEILDSKRTQSHYWLIQIQLKQSWGGGATAAWGYIYFTSSHSPRHGLIAVSLCLYSALYIHSLHTIKGNQCTSRTYFSDTFKERKWEIRLKRIKRDRPSHRRSCRSVLYFSFATQAIKETSHRKHYEMAKKWKKKVSIIWLSLILKWFRIFDMNGVWWEVLRMTDIVFRGTKNFSRRHFLQTQDTTYNMRQNKHNKTRQTSRCNLRRARGLLFIYYSFQASEKKSQSLQGVSVMRLTGVLFT